MKRAVWLSKLEQLLCTAGSSSIKKSPDQCRLKNYMKMEDVCLPSPLPEALLPFPLEAPLLPPNVAAIDYQFYKTQQPQDKVLTHFWVSP